MALLEVADLSIAIGRFTPVEGVDLARAQFERHRCFVDRNAAGFTRQAQHMPDVDANIYRRRILPVLLRTTRRIRDGSFLTHSKFPFSNSWYSAESGNLRRNWVARLLSSA